MTFAPFLLICYRKAPKDIVYLWGINPSNSRRFYGDFFDFRTPKETFIVPQDAVYLWVIKTSKF